MSRAAEWRQVGATLAVRYAENQATYVAAGFPTGDTYRRAFVATCWPNIGSHVKRQIRDGWRADEATRYAAFN